MQPAAKNWHQGRKKRQARNIRRILILCEDAKSSRLYLQQFPFDPGQVQIDCVGTGMNTASLMLEAIRRKDDARREHAPYEQIWVVFDRDDFQLQNFNRAFDLAQNHPEIKACWSNECFEFWYLLHFCYRDTGLGRKEIWRIISEILGGKYDKASGEVFKLLEPRMEDAIRHASRLAFKNASLGQHRRNPSTHVHELVKMLREMNPAGRSEER